MESKRKGNIVGSLVEDANRRKVDGKKVRQPLPREGNGPSIGISKSSSKIPSPTNKLAAAKSSSDLLMKRFEKDLYDVLQQFESDEDTRISEVTMQHIMYNKMYLM